MYALGEIESILQSEAFLLYHKMVAICVRACDDEEGMESRWNVARGILIAIDSGRAYFPWREEESVKRMIEESLSALGINCEQFWWAFKFLQHYSNSLFVTGAHPLGDSIQVETIEAARKLRTLASSNPYVVEAASAMERAVSADPDAPYTFPLNMDTQEETSAGEQIAYEAEALLKLFTQLCGEEKAKRAKTGGPSRNKMLVISRLMYYSGRTNRKSFIEQDKDLKRMLKDHPNPGKGLVGEYF